MMLWEYRLSQWQLHCCNSAVYHVTEADTSYCLFLNLSRCEQISAHSGTLCVTSNFAFNPGDEKQSNNVEWAVCRFLFFVSFLNSLLTQQTSQRNPEQLIPLYAGLRQPSKGGSRKGQPKATWRCKSGFNSCKKKKSTVKAAVGENSYSVTKCLFVEMLLYSGEIWI